MGALLDIDDARRHCVVPNIGPGIDLHVCQGFIDRGKQKGIVPQLKEVQKLVLGLWAEIERRSTTGTSQATRAVMIVPP